MNQNRLILIAEDDEDDYFLTREALREASPSLRVERVPHGEALLDRLRDPSAEPPGLLLLDLNMPRKDGREVLLEIRSDPRLQHLPVIVFTTSRSVDDIRLCYERGVNAFLRKPDSYEALLEMVGCVCDFWLGRVTLPASGGRPVGEG